MWSSPKLQELNLSLNLLTELPTLSSTMDASMFESIQYLSLSVSPEIEQPISDNSPDFEMVEFGGNREKFRKSKQSTTSVDSSSGPIMFHHGLWRSKINVLANPDLSDKLKTVTANSLVALNLAHNSFSRLPKVLACLGTSIQRLNISYNNLKTMGHIENYPTSIRQIDLSHNRIEKWFESPIDVSKKKSTCYACSSECFEEELCLHKKHSRLDHLKTFLLAGNALKEIQVSFPNNEISHSNEAGENYSIGDGDGLKSDMVMIVGKTASTSMGVKNLWFPNMTMLDLSDNCLREVTPRVAELNSLSVLNLSGNSEVSDLPPQMGLLSRMWNLNTNGCNLQEPLKSMIESKRCKTMDVIGYLKSVLEDAKPYTRMKLMVVGIQGEIFFCKVYLYVLSVIFIMIDNLFFGSVYHELGIGKTSLLHQLRQEGSQKHVSQDVCIER